MEVIFCVSYILELVLLSLRRNIVTYKKTKHEAVVVVVFCKKNMTNKVGQLTSDRDLKYSIKIFRTTNMMRMATGLKQRISKIMLIQAQDSGIY